METRNYDVYVVHYGSNPPLFGIMHLSKLALV